MRPGFPPAVRIAVLRVIGALLDSASAPESRKSGAFCRDGVSLEMVVASRWGGDDEEQRQEEVEDEEEEEVKAGGEDDDGEPSEGRSRQMELVRFR